ncbi:MULTISPECIES: transcriptional repressor AgaR [Vibrio]|uniref:transcriptional repressor AgaR n=1 Tax=Vibrio TaxID=662 RepID=UPI00041F1798|nr:MULTISPECIES: transcriptional repressor AgaR [Vibrio]
MKEETMLKNTSQRRKDILAKIKAEGSVNVMDLADLYQVSAVTIRNDLTFLEQQGVLIRSHGGAIFSPTIQNESSIQEKHILNADKKNKIAQKATELIKDKDSIILDSGTTTERIADYLTNEVQLTVMTNGLNVAQKLAQKENIDVIISGGMLRKKSLSFYGSQAEDNLRAYHFDKLFLGVDGFHLTNGITTHSENEARLNKIMSEVSNEVIIVSDSSKFGKLSLHKILTISQISTIITDSGIPEEYYQGLVQQGINVILV